MGRNWSIGLSIANQFFRAIWVLRAPLLVSVVALFVLSQPDQITEIYVALAQDAENKRMQIALALATLVGLGLALWSLARELIHNDAEARNQVSQKTAEGVALRNLPGLFGLVPFVGAVWGLRIAWADIRGYCELSRDLDPEPLLRQTQKAPAQQTLEELGRLRDAAGAAMDEIVIPEGVMAALQEACRLSGALVNALYASLAAALVVLVYILVVSNIRRARFDRRPFTLFGPAARGFWILCTGLLVAIFAAQSLNAGGSPGFDFTQIPRAIGAIALINLFLMAAALFMSMMTRTYDRYGIPIVSLVLVGALAWSYFNWNDNHRVRLIVAGDAAARAEQAERKLPSLTEAFEQWYAARPAERKAAFAARNKPYPVYVMAAQGGGLYSANLTAITLARLYDRCPDMRHHLFAVSGVSGGGVGAGLVAAALNEAPAQTAEGCSYDLADGAIGPLEAKIRSILAKDFLSPLMASALFPDVLQRFLPVPVGAFDRARAFEASVEEAFATEFMKPSGRRNPLAAPFLSHWRPDGSSPMLVLNATVVETGEQLVIAPIVRPADVEGVAFNPDYRTIYPELIGDGRDIPLSVALGLTARFPIIMPAGVLRAGKVSYRLVDGGYFEASGVATAQAMVTDLRNQRGGRAPAPAIADAASGATAGTDPAILAANASSAGEIDFRLIILTENYTLPLEAEGLNEVMSPLRTLLRTRAQRGQEAIRRASRGDFEPYVIKLSHDHFNMALGWQFASQTQALIGAQIGEPKFCIGRAQKYAMEAQLQNKVAMAQLKPETAALIGLLGDNACGLCYILREVRGENPFDMANNPCGRR